MAEWTSLPTVHETAGLCRLMWEKGWTPGGGGNASQIIPPDEAASLGHRPGSGRMLPLDRMPGELFGRYLVVTSSGSMFRETVDRIDTSLGIIHVPEGGGGYELVAGFGSGRPTGEIDSHIAAHAARLSVDPEHRAVLHSHSRAVVELTHVGPSDEVALNRALWGIIPEGIIFLPEGLGFVDWCVPCTPEMGERTMQGLLRHRIVIWQYHGVLATGRSMREVFGNLELLDLCAQAWLDIDRHPHRNPGMSADDLDAIARHFGVTPGEERRA